MRTVTRVVRDADIHLNECQVYTVKEAARLLNVNTNAIYRMINAGTLPAIRIGMYAEDLSRRSALRIPKTKFHKLLGIDNSDSKS